MIKKNEAIPESLEKEAEATYTQKEVDKLLASQREDLREKTIEKIKEKNLEIKDKEDALLTAGQDPFYDIAKWEVMKKMAADMEKSGALPRGDNAFTVIMKMQAGREMGMRPLEAINSLYIVSGTISIWGKAVTRRIREHGWSISYKEKENECTATVKRRNEEYTDTFTFASAQKSGYTTGSDGKLKVGWREGANREQKLRYNVLSKIIKSYLPEVLGSVSEIKEVAEDTVPMYRQAKDGEVVESLDQKYIDQINEETDIQQLIKLCKSIKEEIKPVFYTALTAEYTRRKHEIEAEKEEVAE